MPTSSSTYEKWLQYTSIALFLDSLVLVTKNLDGPTVVAALGLSIVLFSLCAVFFYKMKMASKIEKQAAISAIIDGIK